MRQQSAEDDEPQVDRRKLGQCQRLKNCQINRGNNKRRLQAAASIEMETSFLAMFQTRQVINRVARSGHLL